MKKNIILAFATSFLLMVSCKKEVPTTTDESTNVESSSSKIQSIIEEREKQKQEKVVPIDGKYPVMTFKEAEFDFGDIKQGDKVEHTFEFENTGEADLLISTVRASCGCTVPEYTKEAIKPGESGKVKVTFNSSGKKGRTTKTITVVSNTANENEILKIKTNIQAPN
jgi:hypothetical protein